MIRELPVPPLNTFIREDTAGTALAHLTSGLFEAHARDEAGWTEEGGHRQMWDAARDAALSNPAISPEIYADHHRAARRGQPAAMFPELGEPVERLIRFMANVLAIEVFAASTFAWAEEILSDPEVSDAPDDAANLVRYHPLRRGAARPVPAHGAVRNPGAHAAHARRQARLRAARS